MIGLVHLVWAPLGPEPLRRFLHSHRANPPGAEHELVIVLNGAPHAGPARERLLAELDRVEHRLIVLARPLLDLAAYAEAAGMLGHERVCLMNSYSVVRVEGWLGMLSAAHAQGDVGIAGATGSWESQAEWVRGAARWWPLQLLRLGGARRDYPRFPNPHIRTTAFMLDRALLLQLGLEGAVDKRAAYLLESGRRSITRLVLERDLRAVVVGRDGRAHDVPDWPAAGTYRSGGQQNLLVADNRTRDWELASPRLKHRLSRDAWGEGVV
ncbi:MAG TPA: hypothetical protein VN772_03330 [Solirubrobacteraceae bacterium]|nr:hypothetical protein [Solirubrobacteraceae bacterium]